MLSKKHKLFFVMGIIATPLIIMSPYNWWLIAMIIILFLIIALMIKEPKERQKELQYE